MGLLSNIIRREQLNPGDHIYTWRCGYSYSHHGVYVGYEKVIHLTRAGTIKFSSSNESSIPHPPADRVVCCSVEEFLSGGDLYLYEYGVKKAHFLIKRGGTCTRVTSDSPKDVLHRASILLEKGFGDYDLSENNCEDFAIYCKTGLIGVDTSNYGMSGQIQFLLAIVLVFYFTPSQFLPSGFTSLALVVYGLVFCGFRLSADKDVVDKVAVEKLEHLCYRRTVKMAKDSTRRSLCAWRYCTYAIGVFNYWSWTPTSRILVWFRFFFLYFALYLFVGDHLIYYRMNLKLRGYVAYIIWVLGYWYWRTSESRVYAWTKLLFLYMFLSLLVSKRSKLPNYVFETVVVLGFWNWTPESIILLWIRLVFLHALLFNFATYHVFNQRFNLERFFVACFIILSAALFFRVDYGDYFFRFTKCILSVVGVSMAI